MLIVARFQSYFLAFLLLMTLSLHVQGNTFPKVTIEQIASNIRLPWGMTQLPDGEWLITERSGSILLLGADGDKSYLGDIPPDLYFAGQGGLLDIELHPDFENNGWVYISYASGNDDANRLTIARAKMTEQTMSAWEVLFAVEPDKDTPVHFAGRLMFLSDNELLVTVGDGFDYRESAQKKTSLLGKVLRITEEGKPHPKNPFYSRKIAVQDAIFTLGHRNAQGLAHDKENNIVFAHEHGPAGGDEVNILEAGNNYGWPVVTLGKDYSGANISPFTSYEGMIAPIVDWTPSIAPASMVFYRGSLFESMNGDLLIAALKPPYFYRVRIKNAKAEVVESIPNVFSKRIREIAVGQDGAVYVLTDEQNASLLRLTPAE